MKLFEIETKEDKVLVKAEDKDHAFAQYFMDIKTQKVPLEKIGNIIILHDGTEDYPFRTVPLLWRIGVIDDETAVANLVALLEVSRNEARRLLKVYGEKDAELIVPLMDELAEREV